MHTALSSLPLLNSELFSNMSPYPPHISHTNGINLERDKYKHKDTLNLVKYHHPLRLTIKNDLGLNA